MKIPNKLMRRNSEMRVLAWPVDDPHNPYNRQLYAHIRQLGARVEGFRASTLLFGSYDLVHVHWPDYALTRVRVGHAAFKLIATLMLMSWARLRGKKIMWTVHNLGAHEGLHPRLERWYWKKWVRRLDGYIALSDAGKQALLGRYPGIGRLAGFVIPHGHYRDSYPISVTRSDARCEFKIARDAPLVLFLGYIRAYKNLPHLIKTFRSTPGAKIRLLVAGNGEERLIDEIRSLAIHDARVSLFDGYVAEERVQYFMQAADLVVLPFREILNSGSAILALSFNRPVLAPKRGAMGDLQALVGTDWVKTYDGDLTPEILSEAINWSLTTNRSAVAPLAALEWDSIARSTVVAYQHVVAMRNPTQP